MGWLRSGTRARHILHEPFVIYPVEPGFCRQQPFQKLVSTGILRNQLPAARHTVPPRSIRRNGLSGKPSRRFPDVQRKSERKKKFRVLHISPNNVTQRGQCQNRKACSPCFRYLTINFFSSNKVYLVWCWSLHAPDFSGSECLN